MYSDNFGRIITGNDHRIYDALRQIDQIPSLDERKKTYELYRFLESVRDAQGILFLICMFGFVFGTYLSLFLIPLTAPENDRNAMSVVYSLATSGALTSLLFGRIAYFNNKFRSARNRLSQMASANGEFMGRVGFLCRCDMSLNEVWRLFPESVRTQFPKPKKMYWECRS